MFFKTIVKTLDCDHLTVFLTLNRKVEEFIHLFEQFMNMLNYFS